MVATLELEWYFYNFKVTFRLMFNLFRMRVLNEVNLSFNKL
jgi:hypothetical protein